MGALEIVDFPDMSSKIMADSELKRIFAYLKGLEKAKTDDVPLPRCLSEYR